LWEVHIINKLIFTADDASFPELARIDTTAPRTKERLKIELYGYPDDWRAAVARQTLDIERRKIALACAPRRVANVRATVARTCGAQRSSQLWGHLFAHHHRANVAR
jgi:hypothetical protein